MTLPYRSGPPIFEDKHEKDQSLARRLYNSLLALLGPQHRSRTRHGRTLEAAPQSRLSRSLPFLFITTWILTLWWGERVVFRRSIAQCAWDRWETWVSTTLGPRCGGTIGLTVECSPRTLFLTMSLCWQTLNWLIHIHTLAAHGLYLLLPSTIRTCIFGNPFASWSIL